MPHAVEIVAIGNELVLGETVDTNTSWIARRIARDGIRVSRATLVPDDVADIRTAVEAALRRTRVVICSGGLGPTTDDLTRDVIASLYGRAQHLDEAWLAELRRRYERRGVAMAQINRVQAMIPDGATLLPNRRGTAPGILLEDDDLGTTVLLPGVPGELRGLIDDEVLPRLRGRLAGPAAIASRVLRTTGISEAVLAERVADLSGDIAPLSMAFLPGLPGVDLRLTHWGDDAIGAAAAFDRVGAAVRDRLGAHVYAQDDDDLAAVVGALLVEHGWTIAIAESCTGGLLAKRITDSAGASGYMIGGLVTYSNEMKQTHLGVSAETLDTQGAVSEACAREMAIGVRASMSADIGIAITGIAGPDGGSASKPVGLVWFALATADHVASTLGVEPVTARSFVFPGDRAEIRERAAQLALDMVRRTVQRAPA